MGWTELGKLGIKERGFGNGHLLEQMVVICNAGMRGQGVSLIFLDFQRPVDAVDVVRGTLRELTELMDEVPSAHGRERVALLVTYQ